MVRGVVDSVKGERDGREWDVKEVYAVASESECVESGRRMTDGISPAQEEGGRGGQQLL